MNQPPQVSVIIATHNNAEHIEECLNSIFHQTLQAFEVIVVDVNSVDGTKEFLLDAAGKDTRVTFLTDGMGSLGHAKNTGFNHARAPYVLFVEPDDYIEQDMLEQLFSYMEEMPETELLTCETESFGSDAYGRTNIDKKREMNAANEQDDRRFDMEARLLRWLIFDCTSMYRTSFLRDNGIKHYDVPGYGKQEAAFRFLAHTKGKFDMSAVICYYRRLDIRRQQAEETGAVYDICEEFKALKQKLMEKPAEWQRMRYLFWQSYYTENMKLYEILSKEQRAVLVKRMQADILGAIRRKEFSRDHFDIGMREEMELLLASPAKFEAARERKDLARRRERDRYLDRRERAGVRIAAQEKRDTELLYEEDASEGRTEPLNKRWLLEEMARDLAPLRMLLGFSTDEMGNLLGVSESVYKSLESGKRQVSWDQYMALLFVFYYNDRTTAVIDSLGLYPEPLKLKLRSGNVAV